MARHKVGALHRRVVNTAIDVRRFEAGRSVVNRFSPQSDRDFE